MELVKWNNAKNAIAECKTIDEIKEIRDKAEALRLYAKQAGESLHMQNDIAEIKLRAERKAGELLKENDISEKRASSSRGTCTLPEGINKKQSHTWQRIADIPEEKFEEHILDTKLKNEELTTKEIYNFASQLLQKDKRENLKPSIILEDEFDIIYADPPWQYSNSGFEMSAENKYPTMSIQEMIEQIKFKTTQNAILLLWVTNPLLEECFPLIQAWGFEYKTNMVWIKKNHTAGFYVFGQHELLLICTKGTGNLPEEKFKSIIEGDNNIHSKKPEIVYSMIEKMYPNRKYLELFARSKRQGWISYGNEL